MDRLKGIYENRAVRIAILMILGIMAAVSVYAGVRNAIEFSQDFQWDAAKALSLGIDPYMLSENSEEALKYPELERFYRMFTDRGLKQKMEANQFPSLLMLLGPMTMIAPESAKVVWCVLNILFTAGIVFLLRRTFLASAGGFEFSVITLLMIAGTPYRNQLGVGQHTLFAFFFFMLAVYIDKYAPAGKSWADSILTALCLFVSYFKYTLTAPLALYFVYRKKYKELALSVALHLVLTEAAALWLHKSFIYMIKAPLSVASNLAAEGGIDLGVIFGGMTGMAVAGIIAVALLVITLRTPEDKEYVLFPMLILWSLVLTYHRTYDFFVLSAAVMLFCGSSEEDMCEKTKNALMCWYALLLVSVYFVLRLFSENTISKIAVGALYYAFAVAVTVIVIKMIRSGNKDNG